MGIRTRVLRAGYTKVVGYLRYLTRDLEFGPGDPLASVKKLGNRHIKVIAVHNTKATEHAPVHRSLIKSTNLLTLEISISHLSE